MRSYTVVCRKERDKRYDITLSWMRNMMAKLNALELGTFDAHFKRGEGYFRGPGFDLTFKQKNAMSQIITMTYDVMKKHKEQVARLTEENEALRQLLTDRILAEKLTK